MHYAQYFRAKSVFDREPPVFCYAFAQNYQTIKCFRHDPPGSAMFGFTICNSIEGAEEDGCILFASQREHIEGGHAVAAVGYADSSRLSTGLAARTVR